jgi:hypothetical protein
MITRAQVLLFPVFLFFFFGATQQQCVHTWVTLHFFLDFFDFLTKRATTKINTRQVRRK